MIFAIAEDSSCAQESARVDGALRRVEDKIAELTVLRKKLRSALDRCRAGSCHLVERFSEPPSADKQGNAHDHPSHRRTIRDYCRR